MNKSSIWVVVPAYNEAKHIAAVITGILKHTPNIIVVDDGSTDETIKIVANFPVAYLKHQVNLGKGAALSTGAEYAFKHKKASAIVTIDSDEQHDPNLLPLFFTKLENKATIVLGIRPLVEPMPVFRRVGNAALSYCVQLLFGDYIPDIVSGYRGFTLSAYQQLQWKSQGYGVEVEMAVATAKKKIPFETVAITTLYQNYDRGMTILDGVGIVLRMFVLRILP
jgi:glycosyltransferase involved in cell wall biosynthesis